MIKKISRLLVCGVIILCVGSCVKVDELGHKGPAGVPVNVSMYIKVPSMVSPVSVSAPGMRALDGDDKFKVELVESDPQELQSRSAGTTSLYNLWVLQFGPDKVARKISKISNVPEPVKDMVTIDAELFTGDNQIIYLVALGKQYESIDLSSIGDITELENFALPFVRNVDGVNEPIIVNEEDVPYQGSQGGLSIVQIEKDGRGMIQYDPSINFSGAIPIRAMVSKISIDFSYTVGGMEPYLVTLNNVASSFAVNNPSYVAPEYTSLPATMLVPDDFTSGKRYVHSWYAAPNPQGINPSITSEEHRYFYYLKGEAKGTAPQQGTFVHFWSNEKSSPNTFAQYYMFVGGNNTNDFNIYANNHYKLRSDINSVEHITDKRIVYGTLIQAVDFSAESYAPSNEVRYGLIRTDGKFSLDAHAEMRPIEISALRGVVKVEILRNEHDVEPIAVEDSWLKLSSYPNYTQAYNKKQISDKEGLVTSITKQATIPGIYKFYVYSDEYLKSVCKTDDIPSHKRSLYVRFTFNSGVKTDVTTVVMGQRPAFYLGRFGGSFNDNTGEYAKGLAFESMEEFSGHYLSYYTYTKSPVSRGAYDAPFDELLNTATFDVGNVRNGKGPTLYAATYRGDIKLLPVNSVPKMENVKYIGDKPDLYQYDNQKQNYFAARYCYDKNRDENGDGFINPDTEYHWYLPAYNQYEAFVFNLWGDLRGAMPDANTPLAPISQYNRTSFYTVQTYNLTASGSYASNVTYPRCVRDVDVATDESFPQGFKAYAKDGYAVIDAMGLSPEVRVDRSTNKDLILNSDGRVIRHYVANGNTPTSATLMSKLSARFCVAPYDIDSMGVERPYIKYYDGRMTWAQASGYDNVGNSWVFTEPLGIAQRGCPVYGGIGGDEKGQWRLPTQTEMALIGIMDKTMSKTSAQTGYKALTSQLLPVVTTFSGVYYWTSSEIMSMTTPANPLISASAWYVNYTPLTGTVTQDINGIFHNTNKSSEPCIVRCIKDLPATAE